MGGVFGHMSHIYDNPYMTFGQIKDIMEKASAGELEGTEKTDGQNLFVSYNVDDGTVRAARNKGNIKGGGLTPDELLSKFEGRGALTEAFVNAFAAFEEAVSGFSEEEKLDLFGPDTNIYYNAEVMDPGSANVINYDKKTFLIHRAGHAHYDRETGKPVPQEDGKAFASKKAAKLQGALERTQEKMSENDFTVQVNAIRRLEALAHDEALVDALGRLDSFMSDADVRDKDTIGEYIIRSLDGLVSRTIPDLNDEGKKLIVKRIMEEYYGVIEGEKGPKKARGLETRQILKTIARPEANVAIKDIIKNYPESLKHFIFPIEDIIHDFAVEMLRGLKSAFVLDSDEELLRQRAEVDKAIKAIEASDNEDAMEILKKQMEKLKKLEGISSAAEGFVFDYEGNTYKFTGGFAPMNQILGLFKYGRKGIPALAEQLNEVFLTEDEERKKIIAIYPGRFQPMGPHHAETYNQLAQRFGPENTFVATSNVVKPPKSPLDFEQKKSIMVKHGIPESQIVQTKNPYQATEVTSQFDPSNTAVVFVVGDKDMTNNPRFANLGGLTKKGTPAYYKRFEKPTNLDSLDTHGYIDVAPHVSLDVPGLGEMSGTTLRDFLQKADRQQFEDVMGFYDEEIFNMLKGVLEEMSSMAGGDVQGGYSKSPWPGFDADSFNKKEKEAARLRGAKEFLGEEELVTEVMDYLLGITVG